MRINKKYLFLGLAFFIISVFIVRNFILRPKKVPAFFVVRRADVVEKVSVTGELDASEKVSLKFPSGGLVSWVRVKEGDGVKKGQALASLDTREGNLRLKSSLLTYKKTRADFDQIMDDNKNYLENPDSKSREKIKRTLDKAQIDLDLSVIQVEKDDLAMKLINLFSPISGVISKSLVNFAPIFVSPGEVAFEVVNPESLYFLGFVDQIDVTKIKAGLAGTVHLDSFPDEDFKGKISYISLTPIEGEESTIYKVKVSLSEIKNKDLKYKIGLSGEANFVINEAKDVLAVPVGFVKEDEKGKYVLVSPKKDKIYIETGLEAQDMIEVKRGISADDTIYE
ncbi:MAG: efflux RND transporter periplasmic adaptor subunit [Patescibacteria group bacterium]